MSFVMNKCHVSPADAQISSAPFLRTFPLSKAFALTALRSERFAWFFHLKLLEKHRVRRSANYIDDFGMARKGNSRIFQLTCTAQKYIEQDHFDLDAHHDHDLVRLG